MLQYTDQGASEKRRGYALAGALLCLAIISVNACSHASPSTEQYGGALESVTRELCERDVVLLGESDHGDGMTIEFKTALVRELVTRCRFDAVLFEASHYEFLNFNQRMAAGEAVSVDMLASAIGGLWNRNEEIAPLVSLLLTEAQARRLYLGGIDDQTGGVGQDFANNVMTHELTEYLEGARQADCREIIRRRIYFDYSRQAPYAGPEQARILNCLDAAADGVSGHAAPAGAARSNALQMVASFRRSITRDFAAESDISPARDQSMYENFRWLTNQMPANARIIVWAANAHVAKSARVDPQFARGRNLGSYINEAYGDRAFSLGFASLAGSHAYPGRPAEALPTAGPQSLQALAFARYHGDPIYLGPRRLAGLDAMEGSITAHRPVVARWADVFDGIVIFRAERAPRRLQ